METKQTRDSRTLSGWRAALAGCALCLSLSACGPENKSITEPLTEKERKELKDKGFGFTMTYIMLNTMERGELTDSEKKQIEGLTYKRLKDYLSVYNGSEELDKKEAAYAGEWEKKYGSYRAKVDSIDRHWRQFLEEQGTENFLKIELEDIVDKTDVFMGYVKVRLRFTPLKGRVDKAEANYGLLLKDDEYGRMMERNRVKIDEPFSSAMTKEAWLKFNDAFDIDASKVNELPVSELLKEYDFRTNITRLVVEGRSLNHRDVYEQVPECVRALWGNPDDGSAYSRVYTELVGSSISMPAKDDYVDDRIKEDAYQDDELAATFCYEICRMRL